MKFTKMHGNGNDFIVIEDLNNKFIGIEEKIACKLCNRHYGIGGDGVLFVRKSDCADIQMVIINADGSYASMCGNGIRCFAKYVREKGLVEGNSIDIETGDGVKKALLDIKDGVVTGITINMGKPSFEPQKIPAEIGEEIINLKVTAAGREYEINSMLMGVPHTVIFGKLEDYSIEEGSLIEKLSLFNEGTNVNFCEVVSPEKIKVKTWERGAGPTLACGTGCCASVVACFRHGYTDKNVEVQVPGGNLFIEINDEGVMMTGPAVVSFSGEVEIDDIY